MTTEESKKLADAMAQLAAIKAAQDARRVGRTEWSEALRDNEKHGGIVNKPGEAKS